MSRIRPITLSTLLGANILVWSSLSNAQIVLLTSPDAPIPAAPGSGLASEWASQDTPADFASLDLALPLLKLPGAVELDSLGPISLSNFIKPIGDFSTHAAMPFSATGTPSGGGQNIVARMHGEWAVRAPGIFTLAVGSDDGYRLLLQGATVLDYPMPQTFKRAAVSLEVTQAGLYDIELDYFNGVQEGAVEMSFALGAVGLVSPTAPVPNVFVLVPCPDLYPPPQPAGDAGAGDASEDASTDGPTPDAADDAPTDDGAAPSDDGDAAEDAAWPGSTSAVAADSGTSSGPDASVGIASVSPATRTLDQGGLQTGSCAASAGDPATSLAWTLGLMTTIAALLRRRRRAA